MILQDRFQHFHPLPHLHPILLHQGCPADALADNLNELVNLDGQENVYVEIPQVDLKYIIAENTDVHREIDNWFNHQQKQFTVDIFEKADQDFVKFKRSAQKEVNYLVKEA